MFKHLFNAIRESASKDLTLTGEKVFIIVWALFIIVLALSIDNKWVLAGIIAYEILP